MHKKPRTALGSYAKRLSVGPNGDSVRKATCHALARIGVPALDTPARPFGLSEQLDTTDKYDNPGKGGQSIWKTGVPLNRLRGLEDLDIQFWRQGLPILLTELCTISPEKIRSLLRLASRRHGVRGYPHTLITLSLTNYSGASRSVNSPSATSEISEQTTTCKLLRFGQKKDSIFPVMRLPHVLLSPSSAKGMRIIGLFAIEQLSSSDEPSACLPRYFELTYSVLSAFGALPN